MKEKVDSDDEERYEDEGETSEEKHQSGRNLYKKLEMPIFDGKKPD